MITIVIIRTEASSFQSTVYKIDWEIYNMHGRRRASSAVKSSSSAKCRYNIATHKELVLVEDTIHRGCTRKVVEFSKFNPSIR
jgi:hypothetical protein